MKTIFKHKILAGAVALATIFAASSCEDTVTGLKVTPDVPNADKTLYEVLKADKELTSFMEVLEACGCADSLFNVSRVYTVWAPVNEAMEGLKEELLNKIQNEKGGREEVFTRFIMAHVANHLNPANGVLEEGNRVMMLNDKKTPFEGVYGTTGYTFDGSRVIQPNIRAWNGIIHKLEKAVEYKYNIWEFMSLDSESYGGHEIDSLTNYLYSFNERKFDEYGSIKGDIINGVQTYLDSVFVINNKWLNSYGVGHLNTEDSIYTIYVPTNDVWNEYMAVAETYFNYDYEFIVPESLDTADIDSFRNYYPRLNFVKYLAYSEGERKYIDAKHPDSISPAYLGDWPRKIFPKEKVENEQHILFKKDMSNGYFRIIDKLPYSPADLWLDTIKVEGENGTMRHEAITGAEVYGNMSAFENQIDKEDSTLVDAKISGNYYFATSDTETSHLAGVTYTVPDVYSTKYKVALIIVPRHITGATQSTAPTYLNVYVAQNNDTIYKYTDKKTLKNNPLKLDTLFLPDSKTGEPAVIDFKTCEYFRKSTRDDYGTNISIQVVRDRSHKLGQFDNNIRLDAVMLIPVLEE